MKTYEITKDSKFVVDKDDYYLLTRNDWDGNLVVKLDKLVVVEGGQTVEGSQWVTKIIKSFNCKWLFYIKKESLNIGCKEKTWDEWEIWFSGNEEFSTKRGTKEFDLIQNGYECAKQFRKIFDIMDKYNNAV